MKWLGALLLFGAGISFGICKVFALRKEIRFLETLVDWIIFLKTEIGQRGDTLAVVLEKGNTYCSAGIPDFSKMVRKGISMAQAAGPWIAAQKTETGHAMRTFVSALGRYDAVTQVQACENAIQQLTEQKQALQLQLAEKGKVYQMVPAVLSLLAVLALI